MSPWTLMPESQCKWRLCLLSWCSLWRGCLWLGPRQGLLLDTGLSGLFILLMKQALLSADATHASGCVSGYRCLPHGCHLVGSGMAGGFLPGGGGSVRKGAAGPCQAGNGRPARAQCPCPAGGLCRFQTGQEGQRLRCYFFAAPTQRSWGGGGGARRRSRSHPMRSARLLGPLENSVFPSREGRGKGRKGVANLRAGTHVTQLHSQSGARSPGRREASLPARPEPLASRPAGRSPPPASSRPAAASRRHPAVWGRGPGGGPRDGPGSQ